MMRTSVVVVDDFYADPDAVRAFALKSSFVSADRYNYPGWQGTRSFVTEEMWQRFEAVLGEPLKRDVEKYAVGTFRLITEKTGSLVKVHADTIVDWAAMVYLSPEAPMVGGTGFFRHKEYGLPGPPTDEQARRLGFADAEVFERDVARRDMGDLSRWELVGAVAPRYNRFVAFRGCETYHSPLGGWGSEPHDCRLTQNFFFDERTSGGTARSSVEELRGCEVW